MMPTVRFALLALVLAATAARAPGQAPRDWIGVNPISNGPIGQGLWIFDATNGTALQRHISIDTGEDVQGGNGIAREPVSGEFYAVLKLNGVLGRVLATLCPDTGGATYIGNLGTNISGITFGSDGTLFGITGDGANPAETLCTIDPQTATVTVLTPLGNGDQGEAIAFNPDDGLIYHWSGRVQRIMETVDPVTLQVTNVPMSGHPASEIFGAGYAGNGIFYVVDLLSEVIQIDTAGFAQVRTAIPTKVRGIAPVEPHDRIGVPVCFPAQPNSTGGPASIVAQGSTTLTTGDLRLAAVGLPASQFGYFLSSSATGAVFQPPGSQGRFCLATGPDLGRFVDRIQSSGPCGQLGLRVDVNAVPVAVPPFTTAIQAGETWHFQCWYRDMNSGPTSNFTDAVSVAFQ